MRITDLILQNSFLQNLNSTKRRVEKLQTQIATQSTISRPSDNPLASARILRLTEQIEGLKTYSRNIDNSLSYISTGISAMESMQAEIQNVLTQLTGINNPVNAQDLDAYGAKIDLALNTMLDLANTEFGGKYLFGGTDFSDKPFAYNTDKSAVNVNVNDISGHQIVNVSKNIQQRINVSGDELFSSVLELQGNLDSAAGTGTAQTVTETIYDAEGNEYTFEVTYTSTGTDPDGNNTYDMEYRILDTESSPVAEGQGGPFQITMDSGTGRIKSVDGSENFNPFHISIPDRGIVFTFVTSDLRESDSASQMNFSVNQKADIFNVLLSMKERLNNGQKPTEFQQEFIQDYYNHLVVKSAELGNIYNKLDDTNELLKNQELELQRLRSAESETDVAKAILDLQNQQYQLELSYKVSSMILPQSFLDYL